MDFILNFMQALADIGRSNPMFGAALGMAVAGLSMWFMKSLPKIVWDFFTTQCTTSVTIHNSMLSGNFEHYQSVMDWFWNGRWRKLSRRFNMEGSLERGETLYKLGPGLGSHFFFYKGRLGYITVTKLPSQGTWQEKLQAVITLFTRDQAIVNSMVADFSYKDPVRQPKVYVWGGDGWSRLALLPKRSIASVFMPEATHNKLVQDIDLYCVNREFYVSRGLAYKQTYMLHGVPGTGKTSLVRAIATYTNRSLFILNLLSLSDEKLQRAIGSLPEGVILLIEDIDANKVVHNRKKPSPKAPGLSGKLPNSGDSPAGLTTGGASESEEEGAFSLLTLSGFLNSLDGVVALNDVLVFMTTNHLEKIDPAVLRKGRTDHIIEILPLADAEIKRCFAMYYPDAPLDPAVSFKTELGCNVQAAFFENADNPEAFIATLREPV